MDRRTLVAGFQCAVVCGLIGALLLRAWEPVVVTLAAAATVLVGCQLLTASTGARDGGRRPTSAVSQDDAPEASVADRQEGQLGLESSTPVTAPDVGTAAPDPHPPVSGAHHLPNTGGTHLVGRTALGQVQRVPLYDPSDWDFVKPWWRMGVTQQYMYRPTPERTVEPLDARQKFVKHWAKNADASGVKDRFCVPSGGTIANRQRF